MKHRHTFWTRETAIAALQALAKRLGRVPRVADILKPDALCPWCRPIKKLFGGFRDYQRAAGFYPTKKGRRKGICCKSGRHRMTDDNVLIDRRLRKRALGFTIIRRCRACKAERQGRYPSTKAGREARRLANLARKRSVTTARALEIRRHWATGAAQTTTFMRFAS